MAYKPVDWLGPLIEDDVRDTISWYKRTGLHPRVKRDPHERFEDDGSNLRSEVDSPPLSDEQRVQIIKVHSTEDPAIVISDGFTSVKARLSTAALASLVAEIGGPLDLETKGDILGIRRCIIISTPYGPTEGRVQLLIEDIKYHHHLRKIAGVHTLAGERPGVAELMREVMRIRHPEPAKEAVAKNAATAMHSAGAAHGSPCRVSEYFETQAEPQAEPQSPASQASMALASSPPAAVSQAALPISTTASQMVTRRRKAAPSMARDGVEMAVGVNLERPVAAIPSRFASKAATGLPAKPAAISDSSANLLSVLGKRKAPPEAQTTQRLDSVPAKVALRSEPPPAAAPVESPNSANGDKATTAHSDAPASQARHASTTERRATSSAARSAEPAYRQSWRQRIAKAQKRILDSPASWLPPLPGRQFPHPNVPIELLKAWNEQAARQPGSVQLSQSQPARAQALDADGNDTRVTSEEDDDSSEDSSDSEPQLPWSSSPPRPAQGANGRAMPAVSPTRSQRDQVHARNQSLSLKSSSPETLSPRFSASSRPTSSCQGQHLPPDSSFEQPVAPRALGAPRVAREEVTKSRRTSKDGAQVSAAGSQRPASPSRQISSPHSSEESASTKSPKAWVVIPSPQRKDASARLMSSRQMPVGSGKQIAKSSSRPQSLRHVSHSPVQPRSTPGAPQSTAATVIKGTQIRKYKDERPVDKTEASRETDPTLAHQKRRSEFMKAEQRRKWIKANHTPNHKEPFNLGTLYSAYKRAHPKDELRASQMAVAYKDVFPDNRETGPDADDGDDDVIHVSTQPRPTSLRNGKNNENVASSIATTRPRAAQADFGLSDSTRSRVVANSEGGEEDAKARTGMGTYLPAKGRVSGDRVMVPQSNGHSFPESSARPSSKRAGTNGGDDDDVSRAKPITWDGTTEATDAGPRQMQAPQQQLTKNPAERRTNSIVSSNTPLPAIQRASKLSPPGTTPSATASTPTANGKAPATAVPDHHTWFVKRIRDHQRLLEKEKQTRDDAATLNAGSEMRKFAAAWRRLGPGGAFAVGREKWEQKGNEVKSKGKKRRARLDVLGWEV